MEKSINNIVLIGFMGSGKTSVGKQLAERLGYKFLDTDSLIEKKAGSPISLIFETNGEEYFRNLETDIIKDILSNTKHTVISTGGGLPLRKQNGEILNEIGLIVYLKTSKEILIKRLSKDMSRPLLKGEDISIKVGKLLKKRAPIYEELAHKIIITDGKTINEIVEELKEG